MWVLKSSVLVFLVALSACAVKSSKDDLEHIYNNCGDSITCAEKELIRKIDEVDSKHEVMSVLGETVVVQKKKIAMEVSRGYEDVFDRVARYMAEHEIKLQFPSKALEEVRSSKLKRIILPVLLLLKLKAAIVIPIVLSLIALVAFKGLGVGLLALVMSGAAAFKSAVDHHHHNNKLTYEVVPQPIVSPSGQWSRSGVDYGSGGLDRAGSGSNVGGYNSPYQTIV